MARNMVNTTETVVTEPSVVSGGYSAGEGLTPSSPIELHSWTFPEPLTQPAGLNRHKRGGLFPMKCNKDWQAEPIAVALILWIAALKRSCTSDIVVAGYISDDDFQYGTNVCMSLPA